MVKPKHNPVYGLRLSPSDSPFRSLWYNEEFPEGGIYMPTAAKRKDDHIKVKQFLTDTKGHKMAAVIDIEEFNRVKAVLNLIPSSEAWLYKNKKALDSVQRGLKQAAKGKVTRLNPDEL
jgi:hypothetical protein